MHPVRILKQNAQEERGEIARMSSFVGATALGDLVKTTLGPKGMVCIIILQKESLQLFRTKY
jgi:T-complex protein 1 subunit beta